MEQPNHTFSATALVHEVSEKLLDGKAMPTENRGQFFAFAAKAMRNRLIDHARAKGRMRRGGGQAKVTLDEAEAATSKSNQRLLELDDTLNTLAEADPRRAQVVRMRFFGRMSNEEIADALGISLATVKRDWVVAQAWLREQLHEE